MSRHFEKAKVYAKKKIPLQMGLCLTKQCCALQILLGRWISTLE